MNSDTWVLAPGRTMDLRQPRIMAIINVTPDSFSDGGLALHPRAAVERARQAVLEGADLLDIGGESTRPGAARVEDAEQIARAVPAIAGIRAAGINTPITIDTTREPVARAALGAGADAINDVSGATEDPNMLALAASARCGMILMHRLSAPPDDSYSDRYQEPPAYRDVVEDVRQALAERLARALAAGIASDRVILDPGLGFGKSVEQNLALIRATGRLRELGRPILSGVSRKSFAARAAGLGPESPPNSRLPGTLGLTVAHLAAGARLLRVHDVAPATRLARAFAWSEAVNGADETRTRNP